MVSRKSCDSGRSGGPLEGETQLFFLTDLYLKKGWSLRRISKELGCYKATVKKKLLEAGIVLKKRGLSYQAIADHFNLWKVPTRTREGKWHGKTVRDVLL